MTDPEIDYHFENIVMLAERMATPGVNPITFLVQVASSYLATREYVHAQLAPKTPPGKTLN